MLPGRDSRKTARWFKAVCFISRRVFMRTLMSKLIPWASVPLNQNTSDPSPTKLIWGDSERTHHVAARNLRTSLGGGFKHRTKHRTIDGSGRSVLFLRATTPPGPTCCSSAAPLGSDCSVDVVSVAAKARRSAGLGWPSGAREWSKRKASEGCKVLADLAKALGDRPVT